jgi:hypothetical protein
MKVLVAGWFSFPAMGATAGDILARTVVCEWLEAAGRAYDIAVAPPFGGGVDWAAVDPHGYSDVVFVCGPFGNGWPIPDFLARFAGRRLTGVNLSMLDPLETWNPFDALFERDSSSCARPDLSLLAPEAQVPVVGLVLVHSQKEYRHGVHDTARAAIDRLVASRPMAIVRIDTRLDANDTGLRTPDEVASLIARMDVVVTTRLHGLVLALKAGVPAVAIDPIAGGAKLCRQAEALGWPMCFRADSADDLVLHDAFSYCLTAEARSHAQACVARARGELLEVRDRFLAAMGSPARASS